jgi:serine/threonine-protein kinase
MDSRVYGDICKLRAMGYEYAGMAGSGNGTYVFKIRRDGTDYACKVSENIEALRKEKFYLTLADSVYFPIFIDFLVNGQKAYLVMEYVDGCTLDELIRENVNLKKEEAIPIAIQIAEGINALQQMKRPVLYRDLKAENIIVLNDNTYNKKRIRSITTENTEKSKLNDIKIVDMGSAVFLDEAGKETVGTWGYAPPEQINRVHTEKHGFYSDVYAFGRLLHYMLTGDSPYLPPYDKAGIRNYDPKYDRQLESLISHCTAENPMERIPDMAYLLQQLETIYHYETTPKHSLIKSISVIKKRKIGDYIYEKNIIMR